MSPHLLSRNRHEAQGHECPSIRLVGLDDAHETHASALQPTGERIERRLVGRRQHDRIGTLCEVSGATFTSRVNDLGGGDAGRKIFSDDHIVVEDF